MTTQSDSKVQPIWKKIWFAWESICRGEFVVFVFAIFVIGVCLIFIQKTNLWNFWAGYLTTFAVIWTRFLSLWIDGRRKR